MNKHAELIYQQIIAPWVGAMNVTIDPLFIEAATVGSELLTYDVNKLYLCESLIPGSASNPAAANAIVNFYNAVNAQVGVVGLAGLAFDTVAASLLRQGLSSTYENFYFSRILVGGYNYVIFKGYRITRA